MLHYRWKLPNMSITNRDKKLAQAFGVPNFIITLLRTRGITNPNRIKSFLHPSLGQIDNDRYLDSKSQIHDMKKGTNLIRRTIKKGEKITIYGDYDTDGITATSIMYLLLKHFHADVHYFIPNRFKDGYGPNLNEYKQIIKNGTKLLITVDNGIAGKQQITYAREHGMNVLLTDHHDFPTKTIVDKKTGKKKKVLDLPPANAIIMGKYPGHRFHRAKDDDHTTDFCGAGIAFMIANYMLGHVPTDLLDIVCLGTVADSVSLTRENRTLVKYGVQEIRHDQRWGIQALASVADIKLDKLTSTGLSFSLIPRLNALGRMRDANIGVKLLTTNNPDVASKIAHITERCNEHRQDLMHKESAEALQQAASPENLKRNTLVLEDDSWFPGVVGIIASRVLEKYYKPTIVIGHLKADDKKNIDRGSGRSIPEFNLFKAMAPIRNDMTSFGGHPMACGLSIRPNKVKKLRADLEKNSAKLGHVQPTVKPDFQLNLRDINMGLMRELKILEPFGVDNEQPLIFLRLPRIYHISQMGKTKAHLSFTLTPQYGSIKAVAFGMGDLYNDLIRNPYNIEVAGYLNVNHFRGRISLQIMVQHIRHIPSSENARKRLAQLYIYLMYVARVNQGYIQPDSVINNAPSQIQLSDKQIDIGMKIFAQLGFLTQFNGVYMMSRHPKHRSLKESKLYQKYFES